MVQKEEEEKKKNDLELQKQLKKEQEEYQKWEQDILIEEQGDQIEEPVDETTFIDFVKYLRLKKLVEIEKMALMFSLT
jgi:hypothetical protein